MKYEIQQFLKQVQTHELIHKKKGTGEYSIVNTASLAGLRAQRLNAIYSASKHGVNGITKSVALEVSRKVFHVVSDV